MATAPPSQFSALLRRSKFASYDPNIAQVYTSFDGFAHRGDFGLKRPLPVRRRNAHLTVKAVDSREEQTVWKSAEPQNRWIRMWQEVGITPVTKLSGAWGQKLGPAAEYQWPVDSEFAHDDAKVYSHEHYSWVSPPPKVSAYTSASALPDVGSAAYPNIYAMSPREFDRYLEKLRELRPEFRKFVEAQAAKKPKHVVPSLWYQSQRPAELHSRFIKLRAAAAYNSPSSRKIEQMPQKTAGLSYTRSPPLQSQLLNKPQKGRVLHEYQLAKTAHYTVEFAGMATPVTKNKIGSAQPTPWELIYNGGEWEDVQPAAGASATTTPPKDGVSHFRFFNARLQSVPATVGQAPSALERTKIDVGMYAEERQPDQDWRPNPYPPGTAAYVGHQEARAKVVPIKRADRNAASRKKTKQNDPEVLLQHLRMLLPGKAP